MDRFIARENIRRFGKQLAESTDDRQRAMLSQLLTEARARLAALGGPIGAEQQISNAAPLDRTANRSSL